jgi:hypothetical protein
MIPLLLAASLGVSTSWLQKDLTAPAPKAVDGKSPFVTVLPPGTALPPGAVLSPDMTQQLFAGPDCDKRVVETSSPVPKSDPLAPKYVTPDELKKLGDLPPALLEHAVNRLIDGCPVREIVFGGQTYYLNMPVAKLEHTDPVVFRRVQH